MVEGGCGAQEFERLRLVSRDALPVEQAIGERDHRVGVSSGGSLLKPRDGSGEIGRFIAETVCHHQACLSHGFGLSLSRRGSEPFQSCLRIALAQPFAQQHLRGKHIALSSLLDAAQKENFCGVS